MDRRRRPSCCGASATTPRSSRRRRRCRPRSPRRLYLGGVWDKGGGGLLHPGKLALGLRDAAVRAGVRRVRAHAGDVAARRAAPRSRSLRPQGKVRARRVLLATSAFPPLVRAIRRYVVPVYDYVLVSEPLSAEQRASLGWAAPAGHRRRREPVPLLPADRDDRILWGGYEAVYRFGGPVGPRHDTDERRFGALAQHFFATFPQLRGRAVHAPLGRGDRHVQPLQRLLRHRARRPRGVRDRLHGPRRGGDAVRRARRARPARRPRHRGDAAAVRAAQAGAVPARAAALGGRPADPQPASPPPTATRAGAGCGCARSTVSGSASTADRAGRSIARCALADAVRAIVLSALVRGSRSRCAGAARLRRHVRRSQNAFVLATQGPALTVAAIWVDARCDNGDDADLQRADRVRRPPARRSCRPTRTSPPATASGRPGGFTATGGGPADYGENARAGDRDDHRPRDAHECPRHDRDGRRARRARPPAAGDHLPQRQGQLARAQRAAPRLRRHHDFGQPVVAVLAPTPRGEGPLRRVERRLPAAGPVRPQRRARELPDLAHRPLGRHVRGRGSRSRTAGASGRSPTRSEAASAARG